jgi:lysozyme
MNEDLVMTVADLSVTKDAEGCWLWAYPDPASELARALAKAGLSCQPGKQYPPAFLGLSGTPWTIGYGHTGPDVHIGLVWTQAQADAALLADMQKAEANVRAHVHIDLTLEQFTALCDFAFNIGCAAFDTSTLLEKLNAGDLAGAIAEFARWNKAGGVVLNGLIKRRDGEKALFLLGSNFSA